MMMSYYKNVLEYFEENVRNNPDKLLCVDQNSSYTYKKGQEKACRIASVVLDRCKDKGSVAILLDQSADEFICMLGVIYAADYYTILDSNSPVDRLKLIVDKLSPICLISDEKHKEKAKEIYDGPLICLEETDKQDISVELLKELHRKSIDSDPAYVLFTSGSTGVPKGTVVSHRSIISYVMSVNETFNFDENTVFGNQTPFYFSMSVLDVFCTIIAGATLVVIPRLYFTFVGKLITYLNDNKVNTIYWVPSAYRIVSRFDVLNKTKALYLRNIMFAGEPMPARVLNYWMDNLGEECIYANLYGPTETTDTCTYWIADRRLKDDESVPIGIPFNNCDILVLDEHNNSSNKGELCVRGSFVAFGYFDEQDKTDKAFTLNPLNTKYREYIYRTGDIVEYNQYGELIYLSRKDYQIKHTGYRIELGEIETILSAYEPIDACVCLYDDQKDEIIMVYSGKEVTMDDMNKYFDEKLLQYMRPQSVVYLENMPINANGKIDRSLLNKMYVKGTYNE